MSVRKYIHCSVHQNPVHQLGSVFLRKGRWQPFYKIPQKIPDPRFRRITSENDMTQKIQSLTLAANSGQLKFRISEFVIRVPPEWIKSSSAVPASIT